MKNINYDQQTLQAAYAKISELMAEGREKIKDWNVISSEMDAIFEKLGIKDLVELQNLISDKNIETLLVLNEDGTSTGQYMYRGSVHDNGLFHREVACLPINTYLDPITKKPRILITIIRRSYEKKSGPGEHGLLAGHVVGKQNLKAAAAKEVSEELKNSFEPDELMQIIKPTKNVRADNKAYATCFVTADTRSPGLQVFQPNEVASPDVLNIEKFKEMVMDPKQTDKSIIQNNEYYRAIISALEKLQEVPKFMTFLASKSFGPLQEAIGFVDETEAVAGRKSHLRNAKEGSV